MPMETRSSSALFKRAEQLRRWEESETNKISADIPKEKRRKIQFSDGCVFLAACASGDKEEVERLLKNGADINTANVDGLTALHQACIDDNYEMVQCLVEHNCDINRGDNEGWTPLHATASCGILSIARYLIEHGADVAAVNNDGELPIDIAESEEMERLLQVEIDRRGIDCEAARSEEERKMVEDAKVWTNGNNFEDCIHPKTGATALHVAAAKGYITVMSLLIKAGADVNAQDNDDWTPLHAAAHWGQKEACEILVESLADMNAVNSAGQTCFDVADSDLIKFLEELKKKQNSLQKPEIKEIDQKKGPAPMKRRTSVNRMSVTDKNNVLIKDTYSERMQIEAKLRLQDIRKDRKPLSGIEVELETAEDYKKEDKEIYIKNRANESDNSKEIFTAEGIKIEKLKSDEISQKETDSEVPESMRQPSFARRREIPRTDSNNESVVNWKLPLSLKDEEENVILRKPKKQPSEEVGTKLHRSSEEIAENKNKKNEDDSQKKVPTTVPSNKHQSSPLEPTASLVAQATTTTLHTRRSFVPPVRDEESETQRKAHAKRVRETRRSTQGVTLEDLKSAEQQLLKKQQEDDERQEQEKSNRKQENTNEQSNLNCKTNMSPVLSKSTMKEERRIPSSNEKDIKNESTSVHSEDISSRHSAIAGELNVNKSITKQIHDKAETILSANSMLRSRSSKEENSTNEQEADNEKDGDNRNAQGSQALIQRRRRPKRRSTGVVHLTEGSEESANSAESKEEQSENSQEEQEQKSAKRKEITSSSSDTSERISWISNNEQKRDSTTKDYKKLYQQQQEENKSLKERLKKTENELDNVKQQLQKALQNNNRNSLSDAEKRERRSLERKISELEEELKKIAKLKVENEILKAESKALSKRLLKFSK